MHDDGFTMWKTEAQWHMGHPAHEVWLHKLAAATPEAHVALWHTLLSLDLTGPIRSLIVPIDDPLPYLLTDRRALRTTVVNDGVWLNLPRRQALLRRPDLWHRRRRRRGGGRHPMADRRRQLRVCARLRADLQTDHASMSALLLGGVRPSALVAGRRMTARNAEVLRRADRAVHDVAGALLPDRLLTVVRVRLSGFIRSGATGHEEGSVPDAGTRALPSVDPADGNSRCQLREVRRGSDSKARDYRPGRPRGGHCDASRRYHEVQVAGR